MRPDESYRIHHRVRLPDGRQVEVVYLGDPSPTAEEGYPSPPQQREAPPLHICFHCGGQMIQPVDWAPEDEGRWRLLLRCPECEATREGTFEHDEVDSFEQELDRGVGALISDLRRVTHTNMTGEIEFFVRALHADVIVPSDFQPSKARYR